MPSQPCHIGHERGKYEKCTTYYVLVGDKQTTTFADCGPIIRGMIKNVRSISTMLSVAVHSDSVFMSLCGGRVAKICA